MEKSFRNEELCQVKLLRPALQLYVEENFSYSIIKGTNSPITVAKSII